MKGTKMSVIVVLALGLMVCPAAVRGGWPTGTAFTYQGQLMDGPKPAKGFYDFEFKLFDDPCTVTQFGSTINIYDLDITNGYFTVELDFGPDIFTSDARWLEIGVRPSASPGSFTTLTPRQEVTPAPYALYAETAGSSQPSGIDGGGMANYIAKFTGPNIIGNSIIYESASNVGIGTTSPSDKLEVAGTVNATAFVGDGSGLTGITTTETDPTVPASVKDGIDWSEVSSRPAGLDDGDDVGITIETDPTVLASVKDGVSWSEVSGRPAGLDDGDDVGITSETDPTVPASVKDGVSWSEVSGRPAGLDDGDDVGITSETDPTVPASVKDGIDWSEVSSRPAGLDDGDDVGITSESDPQVGINTTNYIPKWNGSALISGTIYDNGNVGIGTTSPTATIDVNGTLALENGPQINEISIDGTLADNSDSAVPTEKAVKTYVDSQIPTEGVGVVPVGGVIAWLKSLLNTPTLPSNFAECNGQTLSDANSPYDGQTIPNLNGSGGTKRFLRGSTTSGATGGSETHTHAVPMDESGASQGSTAYASNTNPATSSATSTLPSYYEVVWIMRVK